MPITDNTFYAMVGDKIVVCKDVVEWAKLFERKNRTIAFNEIDGVRVSTVFLGIDHSYGDGEPLLFETMVFGGDHDGFCDRYSTKKEAVKGHKRVVKIVFGRNVLIEKILK